MRSSLTVKDALNHAIRVAGPLDTKIADLPIDPYLFGVWLGDGSSGAGSVTSGAEDFAELMNNVSGTGYHIDVAVRKNDSRMLSFRQPRPDLCPYGHDDFVPNMGERANRTCVTCVKTRPSKEDRSRVNRWNEPLALHLRRLGVLGDKYIPNLYLRASIEQRRALLQGIMDTDGTANGRKCAIDLCNEKLAKDVYELISSLGIRATIRTGPATITELVEGVRNMRVVGTRWRMSFSTNEPMFRFERKLAMQMKGKPSSGANTSFRYATDIRPVETRPVRCIQVSSPNHLYLAGKAMIPTHNSLAYAIPAALMAADRKARTVIATESLNLQSQLVEKDLPVVVEAIERVKGVRPTFSLLKGWSNYVCAAETYHQANELLARPQQVPSGDPLEALDEVKTLIQKDAYATGGDVIVAAINTHLFGESGDRSDFPIGTTDEQWSKISITTDECPGADHCPFGAVCLPSIARETAATSDIVVTNHALLAIQTAMGAAVVIGNKRLGEFANLVIDESHGLANTVRSQGSTSVNASRLFDLLRSVEHLHSGNPGKTKFLRTSGLDIMRRLDTYLSRRLNGKEELTLKPEDEALESQLSEDLLMWLEGARSLIPKPEASVVIGEIRSRRRAQSKAVVLREAISSMARDAHNVARWIELEGRSFRPITGLEGITGAALRLSPVDVAPLLRANLYGAMKDEAGEVMPLSVVVVSATLPQPMVIELGVSARLKKYASPFEVAFANSALFIPKLVGDDLDKVCVTDKGRRRFDTSRHVDWATTMIADLVAANGGSALVLSATTAAGKRYADALRLAHPEIAVHSQWDAGTTKQIVTMWRADVGSVLVGTRSLMTGVDAPGATCSLVVIDRIPRSAGNPVDDARVTRVQERLELDRWAADRLVYVADASLLLEQAAGRLIRSVNDSGMCAVLDPRLIKSSKIAYPAPTRETLMESLRRFNRKISDPAEATTWLDNRWANERGATESEPPKERAKGIDFSKFLVHVPAESE
jgi:ATP-dependent DNA helicase DinG